MTTIAWDGRRLAADRRLTIDDGRMVLADTKIHKLPDGRYAAAAGNAVLGAMTIEWLADADRDPDEFPVSSDGDTVEVLVLHPGFPPRLEIYVGSPTPIRLSPQIYALGSGAPYALAAMHCGKSAPEAIEVAAVFDSGTGGGVTTADVMPTS